MERTKCYTNHRIVREFTRLLEVTFTRNFNGNEIVKLIFVSIRDVCR